MAICFRKLLISLPNPTLTSFRVADLRLGNASPSVVSSIRLILSRMLGKLSQLKTFQMSCAEWRPEEGYHVLNTVFQTCRESLQNLYIDGYYTMPWYSQRPYEMDQFTAGLTSLTHLVTLSVDYFCLTNDCVVALAHARRAQMKKLKLVASDINPGSPAIATTSWDALSQACPSMRVDFCINGSVVSPALSVPALLDPVLHIHKIRLAFGKRFILIDTPTLQIADVLQYISSHFRHRLVRFQMDVDNHNDHLDTALIRLVRKCKNLVSLKVQAYFKSAETDRIVQEMVKERRNRLSRTVTQLTPRTAARHTGMVASSSATDRYEDYTSLAGMVVRSSQWVSQWWRGTPQSQGASKNRDAAHSSDASHCRDVSQSRDAPHSSDASHGSDDSLGRDASHSSDALHCRDASLSRDVSHRCDASHSSDDSLSRDASHSSDAPHSSDASQRRDQAGTSH
ncbi:unnamed protein product [Lymnaea stagnalis]|uniref:Uncharacterized protein n=1 Tax=Lymnaea stagnalis TaxID=6523 RepID=A0AAV2I839_LYMST